MGIESVVLMTLCVVLDTVCVQHVPWAWNTLCHCTALVWSMLTACAGGSPQGTLQRPSLLAARHMSCCLNVWERGNAFCALVAGATTWGNPTM
jgi:hypothetical protein